MPNKRNPQSDPDRPMVYQIRIQGRLDTRWADWLGDVTITATAKGHTLLICTVVDQAALYGLLRKVRDIGMPLLSVTRMNTGQADVPEVDQ